MPVAPVPPSQWQRWYQILLRKIRWMVMVRRSQKFHRDNPLAPLNNVLQSWEGAHRQALSLHFLQSIGADRLSAIFDELMRLTVRVFRRSFAYRLKHQDNLWEVVQVTLSWTLELSPAQLRAKLDLPKLRDDEATPLLPAPNPFPEIVWQDRRPSQLHLSSQLESLSGMWLFGQPAIAQNDKHAELQQRLKAWRNAFQRDLLNRPYLAKLKTNPARELGLEYFLSLTLFVAVKRKITVTPSFVVTRLRLPSLPEADPAVHHPLHAFTGPDVEQPCPNPDNELTIPTLTRLDGHSLGSQARIGRRVARTVYGVDPDEWERARSALYFL
ncbi:hypothetical protein BMF94_3974 [Rhodotorula taiwanensis]|uniref:Uncharacterized protein n=1 Tax=Rhodotorula taiwanensis TaxID=741276 RepID=A0A2S5B883_9BASI|nr:hypothetical protein BMF94_3974 [Rhodotorula taiwanensis]